MECKFTIIFFPAKKYLKKVKYFSRILFTKYPLDLPKSDSMAALHPHPDNWPGFVILANNALKASQPHTYGRFVSLMLEPHFYNHELLQIQWENGKLKWYRSIWLKDDDAPKFLNTLEQLKYIGKTVSPTLVTESGSLRAEDTELFVNLLRNLNMNPYLDHDGGIVLDGCVHTLTFGTDYSTNSRFTWNYLPEEYIELGKVTEMMKRVCSNSN